MCPCGHPSPRAPTQRRSGNEERALTHRPPQRSAQTPAAAREQVHKQRLSLSYRWAPSGPGLQPAGGEGQWPCVLGRCRQVCAGCSCSVRHSTAVDSGPRQPASLWDVAPAAADRHATQPAGLLPAAATVCLTSCRAAPSHYLCRRWPRRHAHSPHRRRLPWSAACHRWMWGARCAGPPLLLLSCCFLGPAAKLPSASTQHAVACAAKLRLQACATAGASSPGVRQRWHAGQQVRAPSWRRHWLLARVKCKASPAHPQVTIYSPARTAGQQGISQTAIGA